MAATVTVPATSNVFPIYPDLVDRLANPPSNDGPDRVIARTMATASAYCYADDIDVLITSLSRLGLTDNVTTAVTQTVDTLLIFTSAFLTRSNDGRVGILTYRGTMPTSLINIALDFDMRTSPLGAPGAHRPRRTANLRAVAGAGNVHEGWYLNTRATAYEITRLLQGWVDSGLEALYITGHSYGAAQSALMGYRLATQSPQIFDKVRGIYSIAQPMVGDRAFADAAGPLLAGRLFRLIYEKDVVPAVPMTTARPRYTHFGPEYHLRLGQVEDGAWPLPAAKRNTRAVTGLELSFAVATMPIEMLGYSNPFWGRSLNDHDPSNYISALTGPDEPTVFGDFGDF
jgi:hypothetical protein